MLRLILQLFICKLNFLQSVLQKNVIVGYNSVEPLQRGNFCNILNVFVPKDSDLSPLPFPPRDNKLEPV